MKGAPQVVLDLALRSCSNGARAALAAEVGASIQVRLRSSSARDFTSAFSLFSSSSSSSYSRLTPLLVCSALLPVFYLSGPGGPWLPRTGRRARARAGHRLQRWQQQQQQQKQQQKQQQQPRRQPRRQPRQQQQQPRRARFSHLLANGGGGGRIDDSHNGPGSNRQRRWKWKRNKWRSQQQQ